MKSTNSRPGKRVVRRIEKYACMGSSANSNWQQLRQSSLPRGCGGLFQGKAIDAWGACL
jgi:hypothetical protein